ncbi:hypothetical protein [Marinivivus vitaminiproducens]|uniref:hypothetical protein n=1 Tax=Marinivivus vitaminiproducens TaxID=3035935 RepID=UPI0027A73804|nr:hypothetical protein P4R82_09310 [Geminicoccaceae bacterium SCSIO 64248]
MVDLALPYPWSWHPEDWAPYDFGHQDGTRLEVKQSSALQSWPTTKPSKPTFDIKPRTGFWEGANWTAQIGRNADIYVFAYHPITDAAADHRDPRQWQFYVVPTTALPNFQTITLGSVAKLTEPVPVERLLDAVERAREAFLAASLQSIEQQANG